MKKTHSVGTILINQEGKIAVVNNRGKSWSLPKGHVEPDETETQALSREVWEETGIKDFKSIKELGTYERHRIGLNTPEDESELKVITIYLCTTKEKTLQPQDPDNPEAKWVSPSEVEDLLTHKKDKEFYSSVKLEVESLALS
jgi:ADP-ribose pyrophosphatase YjhB (NUDIX family)